MIGTPVALTRHPALTVVEFAGKGRGLVAASAIREGELLEVAPVAPLTRAELPPKREGLFSYPFDWPDPPYAEAIAFGALSMLNHVDDANCWFEPDIPNKVIRLYADRDIAAGEELTIDYGIPLWFEAR